MQRLDRERAGAAGAPQLDLGVQGRQGDGEVARILGDAALVDAEHGEVAVGPADRRTPRSRAPLVARGPARIAVVGAAGPLQHVAAERGHVAQLGAGGELQRLRHRRIVAQHGGVVRRRRHPGEGPEAQARGTGLDRGKLGRQRIEVDDVRRRDHLELHQIDQRRAAREVLRGRIDLALGGGAAGPRRFGEVVHAVIAERPHQPRAVWSRACLMASTIFG